MIHQNSARFFKDIAYDNGYDGLASADTEACRIAKQLGDKSVMMMGQHGVLVTGKSTAEAFDKTYYLERAAQLQVLGLSTGKKMVEMSDDLTNIVKQQIEDDAHFLIPAHFGAIKRIVAHTYPGDYTS
ncbi:uncharacterized protein LOC117122729 [Anneissia japonica]|uniref:uncharacterized protein LOC117122729 n=1 Tax=Anneissia japonica TaxID=1529436 RepID=UPI0014256B06|nr:uncharacterized protein LOC117122729 [Anneissia japonica]